eukprot:12276903-Alexandrium_andersonii.AAC.1
MRTVSSSLGCSLYSRAIARLRSPDRPVAEPWRAPDSSAELRRAPKSSGEAPESAGVPPESL